MLCLRSTFTTGCCRCHRASRDLREHMSLWDKLRDLTGGRFDLNAFNTWWKIVLCDSGQNMRSYKSVINKDQFLNLSFNKHELFYLYCTCMCSDKMKFNSSLLRLMKGIRYINSWKPWIIQDTLSHIWTLWYILHHHCFHPRSIYNFISTTRQIFSLYTCFSHVP
jgi:hypothetical protein